MIDFKKERINDTNKIKNSEHPKRVVVAGPGTGKSYLFSEIIKKKKNEGKSNFLAITFIGKLSDSLADDLCGLAKTTTLHSFARGLFLDYCKDWTYYPKIYQIIKEDLEKENISEFKIGDENYKEKTIYYKTIGEADVVHYTVKMFKKDSKKIPIFDLILIDEYQDFNKEESELVDLLSQKNEIVIVGDDDQALYSFKHSSPEFIREKYNSNNTDFESHTLRFCSRCTEVIIKYFHKLVESFDLNNSKNNRIKKDYICYIPDKEKDSDMNPKIHLIENCPVRMIAFKIKNELNKLTETQKIKEVLIIGEGKSCKSILKNISQQLKNYGFKNVDSKNIENLLPIKNKIVDAYKFITKDESTLIGWRILENPTDETNKEKHLKNAKTLNLIITGTPSELKIIKNVDIFDLETEIENWEDQKETKKEGKKNIILKKMLEKEYITQKEYSEITKSKKQNKEIRKKVLIQELKQCNLYLSRPLSNLNITVCNILNSKGLGAEVVFLVGFDQGKFPLKKDVKDNEIYQMLVALTRAKKRIYLINTIRSKVSKFIDCLDKNNLNIERIEMK